MRWLGSYAGYSNSLIVKFIGYVKGHSDAPIVFDPMCGGGNLLVACAKNGISYVGYDINPIQIIQARAKLSRVTHADLIPILNQIEAMTVPEVSKTLVYDDWFHPEVLSTLLDFYDKLTAFSSLNQIYDVIVAAFYLMLRHNSCFGVSSNPTWLKKGGIISGTAIKGPFLTYLEAIAAWNEEEYGYLNDLTIGRLECKDIRKISDHDSYDICITSPPYCNRLDYKRMFAPELHFHSAIPGNGPIESFIANNEIKHYDLESYEPTSFEKTLLNRIRSEQAPENRDYYYKYFLKYFHELDIVLMQSIRSVKHGGSLLINVQNSAYKQVEINLDEIIMHKVTDRHQIEELHYSNKPFFGNIRKANLKQKETVLKITKS